MSATLFLDTIEIEVDALESIDFEQEGTLVKTSAFPFPLLRKTGKTSQISLRVAILQNSEVEAVLALDLGGRLVRLLDRRTGVTVFDLPPTIKLAEGGVRGVFWAQGIEWACGPNHPRLNSLGPLEFHCIEQENPDEDPAEIILHELIAGSPISWHTKIALAKNSLWVQIDTRVINRSANQDVECFTGLHIFEENLTSGTDLSSSEYGQWLQKPVESGAGVVLRWKKGEFDSVSSTHSNASLLQCQDSLNPLYARNTQSISCLLCPIQPFETGLTVCESFYLLAENDNLFIRSFEPNSSFKVEITTVDGAKSIANWDTSKSPYLNVKSLSTINGARSSEDVSPDKVQIRIFDQQGKILFEQASNQADIQKKILSPNQSVKFNKEAFWNTPQGRARMGTLRNSGLWNLAIQALKLDEKRTAQRYLDDVLNYAADDHFAWWLKALLVRTGLEVGEEMPERPELLNAHFLAPLEPVLRAEAFLSIENMHSVEPSSVLRPIGKHIDALCDIACLLIETGQIVDAAKFLDEALRHSDHANLKYLMAYLLLQRQNLKIESSQQILACESRPFEAPLPWRPIEIEAIQYLAREFPNSARLTKLSNFARGFQ